MFYLPVLEWGYQQRCVLWKKTVREILCLMKLRWYNFDSVFKLLFILRCILLPTTHGNRVFLKVMLRAKFFSILKMVFNYLKHILSNVDVQ